MVGIVGENGAGKTTLVRHVNGLLKPQTGSVVVDGANTRDVSTASSCRGRSAIAFQNPDHQLFSDSVEKEVAFALVNFGFEQPLIEERVTWALEFFGLEQYRKVLAAYPQRRREEAADAGFDPRLGPGRGHPRRADGRPGRHPEGEAR